MSLGLFDPEGMRKKKYPSDVSHVRFEQIRLLLEGVRRRTKPRTVDLYEVFCAVLYLLKSGGQWRMLPGEFPKWRTVHSYFAKWSGPDQDGVSVLERALKKQVGAARTKQGRNAMTSFLIVDAQSVKNIDSAEQKGYDACKKVSAIKRHIAVDTQGLPHAIAVTTANVTDWAMEGSRDRQRRSQAAQGFQSAFRRVLPTLAWADRAVRPSRSTQPWPVVRRGGRP
jgi:transposase